MNWLQGYLMSQMVSNKGVVAECRWNHQQQCFYMNSPAGLIRYKPKTLKDQTTFRDNYVNLFEHYKQFAKPEGFFDLYRVIRAEVKGVRYSANLHTRAKGVLCRFNPFI